MNPFIKALQDYYTAQISESIATLSVYLNSSVGVGDHGDIFGEIKKQLDILDSANSKLETIEKFISVRNPEKTTDAN